MSGRSRKSLSDSFGSSRYGRDATSCLFWWRRSISTGAWSSRNVTVNSFCVCEKASTGEDGARGRLHHRVTCGVAYERRPYLVATIGEEPSSLIVFDREGLDEHRKEYGVLPVGRVVPLQDVGRTGD